MKRFAWIVVALLLVGCSKSYTENERLNYLDAAEAVGKGHAAVLDADPEIAGSSEGEEKIRSAIDGMFGSFKSKYQGTDLEKDHGFLVKLDGLNTEMSHYLAAAGLLHMQLLARSAGVKTPESAGTLEEARKGVEATKGPYQAKLTELNEAIAKARK